MLIKFCFKEFIYLFRLIFTISMSSHSKSNRAHAELVVYFGIVFMSADSRNPFLIRFDYFSEIDQLCLTKLKFSVGNLGLFPCILSVILTGCWTRFILYYFIYSPVSGFFVLFVLEGLLLLFVNY
jgi:hypothetical protein